MRSKLFVPASRPELFPKALAGQADSLSFDLEDAVAETRKAEARTCLAQALRSPEFAASSKILIVRVNGLATPHFPADLEAVVCPRLDLVNLPKVESADDVRAAAAALERTERQTGIARPVRLLVNIESPLGVLRAAEIAAAHPRVAGLQLGFADLFEPLGIDRRNPAAVQQIQLQVRLAAGAASVWACDTAYGAVDDPEGYRAEALAARRLGYIGKSCIHPSQVALANEIFRPTDDEIAFAQRVVAAATEADRKGEAVFTVDGKMIDGPFIRRAEAIVAIARQFPPATP